jgi:hypothetical protein
MPQSKNPKVLRDEVIVLSNTNLGHNWASHPVKNFQSYGKVPC